MNIYPTLSEFKKISKKGNLIPVYGELLADLDTPLSSFLKVGPSADYSFLLESVEGGERIGRYSFLGFDPQLVIQSKGRTMTLIQNERTKTYPVTGDPLDELKKILARYQYVPRRDLPGFAGGFVGYMGYDMVRFFEDIPDSNKDDQGFPDSVFMLADTLIVVDRVDHNIKIVVNAHVNGKAQNAYARAVRKIREIGRKLQSGTVPARRKKPYPKYKNPVSNMSFRNYEKCIKQIKKHIRDGDIIQAVFSQRFKLKLPCPPIDIYRSIRSINPSPYMYYLKFKDKYIIGSSPEILVRCEDKRVILRPIAGTRPRGRDQKEDLAFERELKADPKERAEHIMLVDLGRNDLGRVCQYNSVKVNQLMVLEKYSHVMHLVSNVEGRLKKGKDQFDVIRATFPAGTVSGAPKVRAMEIIDDLECTRRGPYAGSVGYFSYSGNVDACITIRTIAINGNEGFIQAGGGIVADSKVHNEHQETINKAKAMVGAVRMAAKGIS